MKNKFLILIIFVLLFPLTVFAADNNLSEEFQLNLYKAEVIEITQTKEINDTKIQYLKIKILNKEYKDQEYIITNTLLENNYDIKLKAKDKISVHLEIIDDTPHFYFNNYDRTNHIIILLLIFFISVLFLGKIKGLKAMISIALTILIILFCLIPFLIKGYSPIILSVITCILASVLTFVITNGFTKKTLSAIIGVTGGLIMAGLIAYIFGHSAQINGFSSENAQMLQYLPTKVTFDFKGLLFAGIIIGALGACMDVAISIASSLTEIKLHHPKILKKDLIKSGFNIGKDIMGTMVNTLVLAYTGSSLH